MFKLAGPAGLIRLLALILPATLAACNTTAAPPPPVAAAPAVDPVTAERYAAVTTDKHPVPGVDPRALKSRNVRQLVDYATTEKPGTIVVDTNARFIYLVQEGGKALRYGVGVGKEGLEFKGTATVQRKAQWPRWTPTPDMIKREPERYKKWASGMEGGTDNPLGARALYLFKDGKDTLYRIHGTNEPETIGQAVSSGCIRMMNQDVIDLYSRVPAGAKVVVL
ncbi:L,D-transpeptidase family protein [Microvirga sp. SYSU G3D207]|uniref:L,D-transpeptidase family protein n=1 Tax=Microvirga arsenatis TaxID=2692265 RepID=A0ABW9Z3I0_9HYPH|nr:L,D-transpeptidase [Microvirga arsenatis]NBJ13783.1 L,D-transpeptidase family protein [Microvirga arsenatis]NBJ27254.1 L,D-transpeptidase family protein [Microvirga arsenatis]